MRAAATAQPAVTSPSAPRICVAVLAAAAVAAQVAYPLTTAGAARDRLTVASVVVFFAASVTHATVFRGLRFTGWLLLVTAGGGLLVEAAGVATGVPFGSYRYGTSLGWQLLGVPAVVPMAWTMMGYPALLVGRRISGRAVAGPVAAGGALASWDLFLDPQMVAAGHWTWAGVQAPRIVGIPVVNFGGWFVVATLMMIVLWRLPATHEPRDDRVPVGLYLWTYASSVLAHAAFFDLAGSAVLGGVGMGVVVLLFFRAVLAARVAGP